MRRLRHLSFLLALAVVCGVIPRRGLAQAPPAHRLIGIAYKTWFPPQSWDAAWDTPELGRYTSSDPAIITQHARWLADAGVDFLFIDWSNNIQSGPDRPDLLAIEDATGAVFSTLADLAAPPKISVFLGIDGDPANLTDGRLAALADKVYDRFVANPRYRPLVQDYLGKPLLVVFVGTPSPFQTGLPAWDDPRFTVRWMTGFQDDQPNLIGPDRRSLFGFWSYWDRSPQTYAAYNGRPEAMVVSAAYPGLTGWDDPGTVGRRGGATFHQQWLRAREVDPEIVIVNSWNEWVRDEEMDPERSNDIEPSATLGHAYLDRLTAEVAAFKAGRGLQESDAAAALRYAAGFAAPAPEELARLNVDRDGVSADRLDMRDAVRIVRSVNAVASVTAFDLVVDNADPAFTITGTWSTGASATDRYGADYRFHSAITGNDAAIFRPYLPTAGLYDVYAWWPQGTNRASNAPFRIVGPDGTVTVRRDQRINGGRWNYLGRYRFAEGAAGSVQVRTDATSGVVMADAVRFIGPF